MISLQLEGITKTWIQVFLVGEVKIEELNQTLEQMKASPSAATKPK